VTISTVIEYLNQDKGLSLSSAYYANIEEWQSWWRGYNGGFHKYTERVGDRSVTRQLFSLRMAKKICEDWAAILLNEKTNFEISDGYSKDSAIFVQGEDGTGGVLGENYFWQHGNALVEKAFALGTGAFVLKFNGMRTNGERIIPDKNTKIHIDYLTALQIIPLSVQRGKITEVAFVSEVTVKGRPYIYLETHEMVNGGYQITNEYFLMDNGRLVKQPLPEGIVERFNTGADIPLFAIFSPNIVNTYPDANGLGMSIYAHAIDNLKGVDLAFNNFCKDFVLGGKKVFYHDSLVQYDENGKRIMPDDIMQQLFVQLGDGYLDEQGRQKLVQEFNPTLRVEENKEGLQAQLDYLSFKAGFGTKYYQFGAGKIMTATQYLGEKQEMIQNANKHYIVMEQALQQLVRAILWAGKVVCGQNVNPDAQVTVNFEDSYIIDKETERKRDLQEVLDGIMQPWEFRMKWYGEDEVTAKQMVGMRLTEDEIMGFVGGS